MKKFLFSLFFILFFLIIHFLRINQAKKETALQILDSLIILENEVKPDYSDDENNGDKIYFSPRNYARKIAIMDCEQIIYEKYRLWQ